MMGAIRARIGKNLTIESSSPERYEGTMGIQISGRPC